MQQVSVTALRNNLYQLVDKVIASGEPIEIKRGNKRLFLTLGKAATSKLQRLKPHNSIVGDPDDLIDLKVYTWNEKDLI